jgi:hypothetical protein
MYLLFGYILFYLLPFSQHETQNTWVSLGKLGYFQVNFTPNIIKFVILSIQRYAICSLRFAKNLGILGYFQTAKSPQFIARNEATSARQVSSALGYSWVFSQNFLRLRITNELMNR